MNDDRRTPRRDAAVAPPRHGAMPLHVGTASANFSIAYNGMMIDYRPGQRVDADDRLFDLMQQTGAPVTWS